MKHVCQRKMIVRNWRRRFNKHATGGPCHLSQLYGAPLEPVCLPRLTFTAHLCKNSACHHCNDVKMLCNPMSIRCQLNARQDNSALRTQFSDSGRPNISVNRLLYQGELASVHAAPAGGRGAPEELTGRGQRTLPTQDVRETI